jgi:hypothetical protein
MYARQPGLKSGWSLPVTLTDMASIKKPFSGLCLPDAWLCAANSNPGGSAFQSICPRRIEVYNASGSGGNVRGTWAQVNGTWYSSACSPSGAYIGLCTANITNGAGGGASIASGSPCTKSSGSFILQRSGLTIDVWGMHLAGLWTSSIAFSIGCGDAGTAISRALFTNIIDATVGPVSSTFTCASKTVTSEVIACGGTPSTKATLTVYDDGTFTLT